jgi:hypothetical protein
MKTASAKTAIITYTILLVISVSRQFIQCTNSSAAQSQKKTEVKKCGTVLNENKLFEEGKQTFRFVSFGNESIWTAALQYHHAIAGEKIAGPGTELSSVTPAPSELKQNSPASSLMPLHRFNHPVRYETAYYQQALLFFQTFHNPG